MSDDQTQHQPRQDTATEQPSARNTRSSLTWAVPLALIGVLVLLYFVWPDYRAFFNRAYTLLVNEQREEFQQWVEGFGAWGPLVILTLMLMQTLIAFVPSVLLMIVTVLAYGPVTGSILTWVGLLLAAMTAYGIGRSLGPVTVYKLIGQDTEEKIEKYVDKYGFWAIIAARISPALSTDAVSYVAGLVKMRFWEFVLATGAGTLPLTVLIAYLGADFERLESGLAWVSGLSIALFIGYVLYRRRRDKQQEA